MKALQRDQARRQISTLKRHALALVATGLLAVAIAYLTLSQSTQGPPSIVSDKVYHVIAFAVLIIPTALFYVRSLFWVLPVVLVFGGAIELIQPYVGREGEWADFIADVLGVIFGLILGLTIRKFLLKQTNPKRPATSQT